jgi:hypothetical protein
MGSPAGIVNMSTAQAALNKDTAQVQVRIDDRGSERVAFSFNKTLIKDKLAIYGALLYNDEQFVRKPSYDITRRQYGAITYKPFRHTTLRASVEGYNNDNRRPNSLTPTDYVSEWRNAGSIVYNARTHEFTSLATNQVVGMYAGSAASPWASTVRDYVTGRPDFDSTKWDAAKDSYNGISIFGSDALSRINSILYMHGAAQYNSRTVMQIADGRLQRWFQPLGGNNPNIYRWGESPRTPFLTGAGDVAKPNYIYNMSRNLTDIYDWYQVETGAWTMSQTPLYNGTVHYPGVTDRSIYDWKKVNILSMNFGHQRSTNYNMELEQEIIPNLLHFSAGWFRQDLDSVTSYNVGSLDDTRIYVDTNELKSDGTPNPYVGRPYVRDETPEHFQNDWTVDQYRAMLAFTPDFTKNKNWTRWLGRHQIMGLASYYESVNTTIRHRQVFAYSDQEEGLYRYAADSRNAGWAIQSGATIRRHFYLDTGGAQPGNGAVTQASGGMDDDPVNAPVTVYDYINGTFKDINMTALWNPYDGGTTRAGRTLTSLSAGWTGYLWEDRIITTVGVRRDINKTRGVTAGAVGDLPSMPNAERWVDGVYQYGEIFKRWQNWNRLAGTTNTLGAVVKPFLHWAPVSRRAGDNIFWEAIENLGFSYNKSDNFDAPTTTYVDAFGKPLGKPEGTGRDYGVQVSLLKGKLYARLNWFESDNRNTPYLGAMDRLRLHIDTTAFRGWLEHIYMLNQGADPSQADWWGPWTSGQPGFDQDKHDAMRAWVGDHWIVSPDVPGSIGGIDGFNNYGMFRAGSVRGTTATLAKGTELTVNFNPLPNWTIKLTATKVKTSNSDTTKEIDAWLAVRKPVWDNARAEDYLNDTGKATLQSLGGIGNYTLYNTTKKGNITTFWESTNYRTVTNGTTINSDDTSGWTTSQGYYDSVFSSQYAMQKDLEGQVVSGQRKYNFSVVTNYAFTRGPLKGWAIGGAQRWADKAIIGYYGKDTLDDTDALPDASDVTRPIYDKAMWYTDLWISHTRKIFNDKARMKLQLNVADVFQDGELQPVAADWVGRPYAFRIVDSRKFILTATFEF